MIPVTQPFLPPKSELYALLDEVYDRNWLTNNGPLVNLLESEIPKFLNYNGHFSYVNNRAMTRPFTTMRWLQKSTLLLR